VAFAAIAFGFMLGSNSQPSPSLGASPNEAALERILEQQESIVQTLVGITAALNLAPAGNIAVSTPQRETHRSPIVDATTDSNQAGAPDLAALALRLDALLEQLEFSVRAENTDPAALTARTLREAADPRRARNDHEIQRTLEELRSLADLDEDERAAWRHANFLSMQESLDRFGKPDRIFFEGDNIEWWYEDAVQHADGDTEILWTMYLQFRDGLLVDFDGTQGDG